MTCPEFDTIFKDSEQKISSDLVKKKYKLANAWWGRVPDGTEFPRNSGTNIKKVRLTRIGFGEMEVGWQTITDDGCTSNLCADVDRDTMSRGWDESFYSIERFGIKTDDICLALLPFREMPEEELMHFEDHLRKASQYFWNEYARSRWVHIAENKMVVNVNPNVLDACGTCDIVKRTCNPDVHLDGFVFWRRNSDGVSTVTGSGPIDERYLSVNVNPSQITTISELTCDILDIASQRLELEDENMPFLSEGTKMFDVVLPHPRIGTRLKYIEDEQMKNVAAYSGDIQRLMLKLGTTGTLRDMYSIRYDNGGMRLYPDTIYNATIFANYGAYDPNDPQTWPRFRRVFPYVPRKNSNGSVKYILNDKYIAAPFGVSMIFTPLVYRIQSWPETRSVGSAAVGDLVRNYAGSVKWINEYDKKCNPRKEIGHWELDFGAAAEPHLPENGYAFFHRIDHTVALAQSSCAIPDPGCFEDSLSAHCYKSVDSDEEELDIAEGDRGANTASYPRSNSFLL